MISWVTLHLYDLPIVHAKPKSPWRWFWRLAGIVICVDVIVWMDHSHRSVLNLWGHIQFGRTGTGPHPIRPGGTVYRTPTQLIVVSDFERDQAPTGNSTSEIAVVFAFPRKRVYGLLAPVVTLINAPIQTSVFPGHTLTPSELVEVESQYATILQKFPVDYVQEWGERLARGITATRHVSMPLLVHDIGIAALALALATYVTRRGLQTRANSRAHRRLRRGQCPACTYDLSALRATPATTCPECGTPIPPIHAKLPIG